MPRARKTSALTLVSDGAALIEAAPEDAQDAPAVIEAQDCRTLALRHASAAIEVLAKIMNGDGSETSRIAAANALLDRAYGKARAGGTGASKETGGVVEETRLTVLFV